MDNRKTWLLPGLIVVAALLIRVIFAFNAIDFPERFIRPDTPTYLEPAKALLEGRFSGTGRAPGYTLLAAGALFLSPRYHAFWLALAGTLLSTLTLLPLYAGTKALFNRKAALIAMGLYALNLTVIANAPMLLSDTLFGLFAALQFCFFARFYRKSQGHDFFLCILFAALGTLIRPINLPWIAPALVMLFLIKNIPLKKKLILGTAAVAVYALVLLPWMARNAAAGAPWCIDTNTGAMVHQNGAMILAEANGTTYEHEKNKIRQEYDTLFLDKERFPDEKSKEAWKMQRLRQIIAAHPFIALKHHFNWHRILLPDAPTLFEITGMTKSDRGTMNVLVKKGIIAAVDHYFEGRWYLPAALFPLLAVTGITYLGTLLYLLLSFIHFRRRWYMILLFLGFAEFYLFLPGAICAPRYQIPALPLMCGFAGMVLFLFIRKIRRKYHK